MMGRAPKTQVTRLNGINLQSSVYGLPLGLYFGTNRGTGNLIWYGNFKATPHTQKASGGKGLGAPSSKTTDYTYSAAVVMALGEGPIAGIGNVWKGKDLTSLSALGLTLIAGNSGQAPWSFLTSYNVSGNWAYDVAYGYTAQAPAFTDQKLGYDTTALLVAPAYDLGSDATIQNHGFEIISTVISAAGTGHDCDPADFVTAFLTSAQYGVSPGFPLGSLTNLSNYCLATGILISPSIVDPQPASQYLSDIMLACNTDMLWSDGVLKFLPRGDTAVTGNGRTYTPNMAPLYDLSDSDYGRQDGSGPVKIVRATPADAFNEVRLEISNRANQYNSEIIAQNDQNAVELYGLRQAPVTQVHFICEASVGKLVAQIFVQRSVYVRNTYEFPLTEAYALLEPGDLVTLTDSSVQMSRVLVRITDIDETESGYDCKAEDVPIGVALAATYTHDSGLRFLQDFNSSPLAPSAPFIFELPADPSATGLSLGIAIGTQAADLRYGGCHVWASTDGTNYQQVGTINGSSRYGVTTASITAGGTPLSVQLTSGGQLPSVSAGEAAQGATMMAVGTEYMDYTTATLTGAGAYNLTSLIRGFYLTPPASHASGTKFARIDDAICRLENMDLTLIGQTLHFKFTAFNTYGGGELDLASATDYTYTITGYMQALGVKAELAKISLDGWLTPDEKIKVIQDKANVDNEYTTIVARAAALSVSSSGYATAKSNLDTYLAGLSPAWNLTTASTAITRSTWDTVWEAYYNTREILLSNIAAAAALVATWAGIPDIPTPISDGRVGAALDSAGNLQTGLDGGGPATMPVATLLDTASGTQLAINPEFTGGVSTGYAVYNNAGGSKVAMAIVADPTAPNGSGSVLHVSYDGTGTPNTDPAPQFGGVAQSLNDAGTGASYPGHYARGTQILCPIWANIPVGRTLNMTSNAIGAGGVIEALTPMAGTGAYALYVFRITIGAIGTFSSAGYLYISGGANSAFTWGLAKYDQIDITSAARTFGGTGGGLYDVTSGLPLTTGGLLNDQLTVTADTGGTGGRGRVVINMDGGATPVSTYQLPSVFQNLDQQWNDVGGTGKPENGADVTFTHVAASIAGQKSGATTQFTRSTTAPSSPVAGDHWTDVNFTPPREKIWSGSAWVSATPTQGTDVGVDNGATLGAAWSTNVTGRPTELTDGRVAAALNSSGDLARDITTSRRNSSNLLGYVGGGTFGGELGADQTSLHVAASISGQAATATSSDFAVITGATRPAPNAGTSGVLTPIGSYTTVVGNLTYKSGGTHGAQEGGAVGSALYGPAYVTSSIINAVVGGGWITFIALDDDATSYTWAAMNYGARIDVTSAGGYSWYLYAAGSIVDSGSGSGLTANSRYQLNVDDVNVTLSVEGVVKSSTPVSAPGQKLWPKVLDYYNNTSTQPITDILSGPYRIKADPNADVTADKQAVLIPPNDQIVAYDYTATAKTGQLTRDLTNVLKIGGTDVSASATWAYTPSGCSVTPGSNGVVTLNSVSASLAFVAVTATYGGKTYPALIRITKTQDAAPAGGAGATAFGDNGVSGTVNETAYTTPIVIASGDMNSNGSSQVRLDCEADYSAIGAGRGGVLSMKAQYSANGTTGWTDCGLSATGSAAFAGSYFGAGDQYDGVASFNALVTLPSANTHYWFRVVAKYGSAVGGLTQLSVYGNYFRGAQV